MLVVGTSGTNGSGKDTVAQLLGEKYGFYVASATNMLGSELKRQGLPTDRKHKRGLSAKWRRQHGLGVIVQRAVDEGKQAGFDKVVVGSLRNPGEAELVHKLGGKVIWVDAKPDIRYKRIKGSKRGRVEDDRTYEEFLIDEQAEMEYSGDEATLSGSAVKEAANIFIENNGDNIKEFEENVEKILRDEAIIPAK